MGKNHLAELRERLAGVDREIMRMIAERQRLSGEIGRIKQTTGRSVRDYAQEKVVLERARREAEAAGVSPAMAESVVLELIRGSLALQERDKISARRDPSASGRALVIGGAGRMGRWFCRFLDSCGYQVTVADPAPAVSGFEQLHDWRDAGVDDFHVSVVAAPLRASAEILSAMARRPPAGAVFDVGSLKSPLAGSLRELVSAGVPVASIHPMFGPDTELLSGKHVILVDLGCEDANAVVRSLFSATAATVVSMDLASHDRLVSYVLGLSHALNIVFFNVLSESGEEVPDLRQISSTTFDAQLEIARRVAQENPHLYFEIQALNEFGEIPLGALGQAVERLREVVSEGDESGFVELMERGRDYFRR